MHHCLIDSAFIAVFSFCWIRLLIAPGMLLDFVPPFIEKWVSYEKVRTPIIYCEKCLAGQIAFWYGLIRLSMPFDQWFMTIIFSITMAAFLGAIYDKLMR